MFLVAQTEAAAIFYVDAGKAEVFVQEQTESPHVAVVGSACSSLVNATDTSKQIWSIIWHLDGANIWISFSGVLPCSCCTWQLQALKPLTAQRM